jgi:hypothetical protein
MPDEEILGFWGKRPFLAKRIPKESADSKPADVPSLAPRTVMRTDTALPKPDTQPLPSWHRDTTFNRKWHPRQTTNGFNKHT